jgi:sporulation protein YabP
MSCPNIQDYIKPGCRAHLVGIGGVSMAPLAEMLRGERLTVTGVEDVDRFDETGIVMSTSAGTLVITGENLHIGKLSLDGGELHVDGRIDVVSYEDDGAAQGGFFSRLFGG